MPINLLLRGNVESIDYEQDAELLNIALDCKAAGVNGAGNTLAVYFYNTDTREITGFEPFSLGLLLKRAKKQDLDVFTKMERLVRERKIWLDSSNQFETIAYDGKRDMLDLSRGMERGEGLDLGKGVILRVKKDGEWVGFSIKGISKYVAYDNEGKCSRCGVVLEWVDDEYTHGLKKAEAATGISRSGRLGKMLICPKCGFVAERKKTLHVYGGMKKG